MGVGAVPAVCVDLLGPLRVVVDGREVEVPGPKRRAVLVLLALAEGRVVPVDDLLDALWPAELPESGRQALQTHVSRLRAQLGPAAARLQTRPDGYRLDVADGDVDVVRARSLLSRTRSAADRDPAAALATLRAVRSLWRGPALADLTDVTAVATAVEGIAQLHREVTDALVDAAIRAGESDAVLATATATVDADPLREASVLLLMRALAASGRATEALASGRAYRRRLAEETGLDPSPALADLERSIAAGSVSAPARARAPARRTTRMFGRAAEVAALHRVLATERLVTLAGPGGVGKTRLADEVAARSDEVTCLSLAPVTEPTAVPLSLASALDLDVVQGDVLTACVALIGDDSRLLVVDNCEHLLDAVRDTVDAVLAWCPNVTVLATSREPLGVPVEYVFRLSPLPLPRSGQDLAQVPSVAVFLDRARRARPEVPVAEQDLGVVADVVRRLDGMPLAIELAAGRLSTMSLTDLHRRLDRALDLLGGGRPSGDARHRTLRATVEWSYDLLDDGERRLLRHLAVFVDGVDLPTAERVAAEVGLSGDAGSVLAHLVDASLVQCELTAGTRYRMLETLRAFGLDRLAAAGEQDGAAALVLRWAADLTRWIGTTLETAREPEADRALRRELPNLRAAWRLARACGRVDDAVALVVPLFEAIAYRDLVEIRGWAEELAADDALAGHPAEASVLGSAAEAAYHRGDYVRAERLARTGLDCSTDATAWRYCLLTVSVAELARGAFAEVVEHCLTAVELTSPSHEGLGLAALATAYAGDLERARELNDAGLRHAVSPTMVAWGEYVAGEIDAAAGLGDDAERHYEKAITLAGTSGATFLVGVARVGLVSVLADSGRVDDALRGYREVVDYFARTGNWTHLWVTLRNLARLLRRLGDDHTADLLVAAADQAPDAPADESAAVRRPAVSAAQHTGRDAVLDAARRALARALRAP